VCANKPLGYRLHALPGYDGDRVIAEYEDDTLVRKFIYCPGIDEPICMIDVTDSNAVYYYHFGGLGSVVALSNVNGEIVERYEYDAYGRVTIWDANLTTERDTSSYGNPYYFTGRRMDVLDSNDYQIMYYRNRYYDPQDGRFLTNDPLGYIDGLNLYEYVRSNPVLLYDPFGTSGGCGCCEYMYIKNCGILKQGIEHKLGLAMTVIQNLAGASLSILAEVTSSVITATAAQGASIILSAFPSTNVIFYPEMRGFREEKYILVKYECGDNNIWDYENAQFEYKYEEHYGEYWGSGFGVGVTPTFLKERLEAILLGWHDEILEDAKKSIYCKSSSFRCKKGDPVIDPDDPDEIEQSCESFEWRTE
jgi:RHS repeat-associated protein